MWNHVPLRGCDDRRLDHETPYPFYARLSMLETLIMPESTYYYAIIFCLLTSIWFFVNRIIHSEKDVEARHHYQEILFIPAL